MAYRRIRTERHTGKESDNHTDIAHRVDGFGTSAKSNEGVWLEQKN